MPRISRGSAEEKANRPFATVLRSLMAEPPSTSQADLARILDKTQQTIGQYVSGKSEPGYDVLVAIADYFQVSVDFLLGRQQKNYSDFYEEHFADVTGLSDQSVLYMKNLVENKNYKKIGFINEFINFTSGFSPESPKQNPESVEKKTNTPALTPKIPERASLTLNEACEVLRSYGIRTNNTNLANMIESGDMPIGTVVNVSKTGRRHFLIFAEDLISFCERKKAKPRVY